MKVEDVMTKNPIVVHPDTPVREALRILHDEDIRHLPVVNNELLVGIISDRDLRAFLPNEDNKMVHPDEYRDYLNSPVSSLLQTDVIQVAPDVELSELIDIMVDQKVGAVPVVSEKSEHLLGIVSYLDVLRAVQDIA